MSYKNSPKLHIVGLYNNFSPDTHKVVVELD